MKKHSLFLFFTLLTASIMAQKSDKIPGSTSYPYPVEVKNIESFQYVYYEFKGSYMKAFDDFPALMTYIESHGIQPGKNSLGVYYDDPADVPEEELRSEIGMMVSQQVSGLQQDYKYKKVEAFKAATIKYTSMDHITEAYNTLFKYIEEKGLIPSGAPFEFYYSYEPGNLDCEILVPVQ